MQVLRSDLCADIIVLSAWVDAGTGNSASGLTFQLGKIGIHHLTLSHCQVVE